MDELHAFDGCGRRPERDGAKRPGLVRGAGRYERPTMVCCPVCHPYGVAVGGLTVTWRVCGEHRDA